MKKRKGLLQALLLAAFLAAGFQGAWGFVAAWAFQLSQSSTESFSPDSLAFLADGTVLHVHADGPYEQRQYRDLQGNAVEVPDSDNLNAKQLPMSFLPLTLVNQSPLAPSGWEQRIRSFTDGTMPPVHWHLVTDGGLYPRAYFVGYDCKTSLRVGYLGTAGFRADPVPPDEMFELAGPISGGLGSAISLAYEVSEFPLPEPSLIQAPAADVYLIGHGGNFYHVDLRNRRVRVALHVPGLCSAGRIDGMPDANSEAPPPDGISPNIRRRRLAVRSADSVLVLNLQGKELKHFSIPAELRDKSFSFGETDVGEALMLSSASKSATLIEHDIFWVPAHGDVRHAKKTLTRSARELGPQYFAWTMFSDPVSLAVAIAMGYAEARLSAGLVTSYPDALLLAIKDCALSILVAQLLSVIFAFLCYRRQVRYGARGSERIIWPLFVLALGLPGWIGYRFGRTWPVLAACETCGATAPRTAETCNRCTTEFASSPRLGTELFA